MAHASINCWYLMSVEEISNWLNHENLQAVRYTWGQMLEISDVGSFYPLSCFDLWCNHLFIILLALSCQIIYNLTLVKNKRPEPSLSPEIYGSALALNIEIRNPCRDAIDFYWIFPCIVDLSDLICYMKHFWSFNFIFVYTLNIFYFFCKKIGRTPSPYLDLLKLE